MRSRLDKSADKGACLFLAGEEELNKFYLQVVTQFFSQLNIQKAFLLINVLLPRKKNKYPLCIQLHSHVQIIPPKLVVRRLTRVDMKIRRSALSIAQVLSYLALSLSCSLGVSSKQWQRTRHQYVKLSMSILQDGNYFENHAISCQIFAI